MLHPNSNWRLLKDGAHWTATAPGFLDTEQSPFGMGETQQQAIDALLAEPVIQSRLASSHRPPPALQDFTISIARDNDDTPPWQRAARRQR